MITALLPISRGAILRLLLSQPDQAFYLRQIARLTDLAVGNVQRELALLVEHGILQRRPSGRHVYFQADPRCPFYDALRTLVCDANQTGTESVRKTRRHVVMHRQESHEDDSGYMPGTMAQRMGAVMDLTQSAWAFMKGGNAQYSFQRDVAVLARPER